MVALYEKWESRATSMGPDVNNQTKEYLFLGTDDEGLMNTLALTSTPASISTPRGTAVRQATDLAMIAPGLWSLSVEYGLEDEDESQEPPETGDYEFSIDTSGGSTHITTSLSTSGTYAVAGYTAPDFNGAIGVSENGVEGADIIIPSLNLEITGYLPDAVAGQPAYWKTLARLTGKTNAAQFYGFAVGEVLFKGATLSPRGRGDWQVKGSFACSENAANLNIANGDITVTSKKGHELLWVLSQRVEDATAHKLVHTPKAAYVEQVYEAGDFSLLQLGS